jgi:hypothetical protein
MVDIDGQDSETLEEEVSEKKEHEQIEDINAVKLA